MWTYLQKTGTLIAPDGEVIGAGYSGSLEHKNRPESQGIHNHGPIPRGTYRIGTPRASQAHGPYVLPLTPGPQDMEGRAGFLIHGDSTTRPGTASQGCVILSRLLRVTVWESGDRTLRVVAGIEDL